MLREIRPAVVASGDRWGCIVAFIGRTARGRSACPWGRGKLWMRTVCWGFRPSARRRSLDAMARGREPLDTEGTSVFYGSHVKVISPMPDIIERMSRNVKIHPKEATKRIQSSRGYAQDEDYVGNRPGGYTRLEGCSQTCWLQCDPRYISLSNRSFRDQVFLWSH